MAHISVTSSLISSAFIRGAIVGFG